MHLAVVMKPWSTLTSSTSYSEDGPFSDRKYTHEMRINYFVGRELMPRVFISPSISVIGCFYSRESKMIFRMSPLGSLLHILEFS